MKLIHTNSLAEVGVSHDKEIKKKIFLEKGIVPNLMMFGSTTFKPGQSVESHVHKTMYEVFYIQSGKADFKVNDTTLTLQSGDCIAIEEGEFHSMSNPYLEDTTWIYFGIATDKQD